MKKLTIFGLLLMVSVVYAESPKPEGRYQLVPANLLDGEGRAFEKMTLFKIDSVTGKTWIFTYHGAQPSQGIWVELQEVSLEVIRQQDTK